MSWGNRVIIILLVFLTGMTIMVYVSMQQTNEVVDANYYEQEMKYQGVINGKNNLSALNDSISIINDGNAINITLPAIAVTQPDSGSIQFLKLSDSKADKLISMGEANKDTYLVPLSLLSTGWYKVRINWANKGIVYYHEQNFNIR